MGSTRAVALLDTGNGTPAVVRSGQFDKAEWEADDWQITVDVLPRQGAKPVKLVIESLGPQDDDLRVDIDGLTRSDTQWSARSYYNDGPGVSFSHNPDWQTQGWRRIVIEGSLRVGSRVKLWLCEMGGLYRASPVRAVVYWSDGGRTSGIRGETFSGNPAESGWPPGTTGEDLSFPRPAQPYPPGSPPVYIPLAEWTIAPTL